MRKLPILVSISLFYLCLISIWVPNNFGIGSIYNYVNLFDGLKPRAIFGTVIELLAWTGFEKDFLANILRISSIIIWIYCINAQLYQSIFSVKKNETNTNSVFIFLGLSFIFSFSSVTLLNFSVVGFIDAMPYAIMAFIATSNYLLTGQMGGKKVAFITIPLVVATLIHEKSIFDISIFLVWFSWKWGIRKSFLSFSPALILSLFLLAVMGNKVTSGESPIGYLTILGDGLNFFWGEAFNIYGLLFGGGVFGLLYLKIAIQFFGNLTPQSNKLLGILAIFLMPVICISTLLVAHDTNRMISLIWLPLLLIIKEINLCSVFDTLRSKLFLMFLCLIQAITPPMLIYSNGMVGLNCYGLWLSQLLPSALHYQKTNQQVGLYRHYRPEYTESFINQCNDDRAIVTHIIDRFSKEDLSKTLVIYDASISNKLTSMLPTDLAIESKKMYVDPIKINVSQIPEYIRYVILLGSNIPLNNGLNQDLKILFSNQNIVAAEITAFYHNPSVDFTQFRWPYMVQDGLFSPPESWGAWSISKEVVLKFSVALPSKFELIIDAKAFGPNVGKDFIISIGQLEYPLKLDQDFSEYRLLINNPKNLNEIKIAIPFPTSPKELNLSDDQRKLGIALKKITIKW